MRIALIANSLLRKKELCQYFQADPATIQTWIDKQLLPEHENPIHHGLKEFVWDIHNLNKFLMDAALVWLPETGNPPHLPSGATISPLIPVKKACQKYQLSHWFFHRWKGLFLPYFQVSKKIFFEEQSLECFMRMKRKDPNHVSHVEAWRKKKGEPSSDNDIKVDKSGKIFVPKRWANYAELERKRLEDHRKRQAEQLEEMEAKIIKSIKPEQREPSRITDAVCNVERTISAPPDLTPKEIEARKDAAYDEMMKKRAIQKKKEERQYGRKIKQDKYGQYII